MIMETMMIHTGKKRKEKTVPTLYDDVNYKEIPITEKISMFRVVSLKYAKMFFEVNK